MDKVFCIGFQCGRFRKNICFQFLFSGNLLYGGIVPDLFQQKIRNQGIGSKRHMAAVALDAADGDEHHIVLLKVFLCLRPGQICKSHIFYFLFMHNFE